MVVKYEYPQFREDLKELILKIDWEFDAILAITRGGLTISHFLSQHYNIRDVYIINAISYDDKLHREMVIVKNIPDLSDCKRVLIVDEIVDSGKSGKEICRILRNSFDEVEFKFATLFYKPNSLFKPDYFVKESSDWIEFFWEESFFV